MIRNGYDIQVVQSCENGFLADPQAAGDHGELQVVVGLQGGLEKRADQRYHPVIKSAEICVLQGHIVFIDEDDGFLSGTGIQAFGQELQESA